MCLHQTPKQPLPPPLGLRALQHGGDLGPQGAEIRRREPALCAQSLGHVSYPGSTTTNPGCDVTLLLLLERGVFAERALGGRFQRLHACAYERFWDDVLLLLVLLLLVLVLILLLLGLLRLLRLLRL